MHTTHLPKAIREWLNERTLTDEIIERFKLSWNGSEIVIPIFNKDGDFLFNKYRRNPTSDYGPKYKYDKGAERVLYNEATLTNADKNTAIFIVEGELDAIALENIGMKAVTTTGGAGTFEEEWIEKFEGFENLIICMDNDPAGVQGAIKIQSLLPHARMLVLPLNKGKDVTDFLKAQGEKEFLALKAEQYTIPRDISDYQDRKELSKKVKEFREACDAIVDAKREANKNRQSVFHINIINDHLKQRYESYQKAEKSFSRSGFSGDSGSVEAAKQVPIDSIIKFNYAGYAPCIWHTEKTASMFYNKPDSRFPNTVKCFGCGMMGDVIDVVSHTQNKSFQEAVDFLTGK